MCQRFFKAITYQMSRVCGFVVTFEKIDGHLHCRADTEGVIIRQLCCIVW